MRYDSNNGRILFNRNFSITLSLIPPPQYIISVNIVTATSADGNEQDFYSGGKGKITEVRRARFFYNWDLREMYVDSTGKDGWRFLPPLGSWAETGVSMPAGETAFYLAYKMKFYGSKKFYDSFLKKSICPYGDEFYARI